MADEIKLKAPTVEQQVVVNINGEEKLRSFADTLDKISNNKNLQKYWKTQQELINATANAYGNFQKKASKDNATELIKVTNALKAMSGTDLSNILPDFDKISKAMAEAQKVVGNIDSAFSVKGFKEAFDSFETLKAYSEDIEKIFSHFGVSSDVSELQNNVRALEGEVEKLTRRLANAKNANEELRNEFNNFKSGSGFADKLDELDNLKSEMSYIREEAEETFRQFLKLNNVSEDGYDRDGFYDDNRFREYFQNIQSGYMSASDAIRQFKTEYSYLLEESFKTNNDTFGLEQLQAFSNKLDSIFRQVEETSTKINDIISNGVITKSVENLSIDSSLSDSQRSLFGNLLQDEESLKSITALFQKLIEESNKTSKVDLFNDEQLQQVLSIFDKMEGHLSSLRSIISDVGDGEEFSPLLKMINNVQSSISELATSVKGIGLNMNIDVGSDSEMEAKVQSKIANALQAYQRLFDAIKMSGAGGSVINTNFFEFDINQYDTMMSKIQAYKKFIDNMRNEAKAQYNGKDILYQSVDKTYWTQASAAMGQVTKAFNEMNATSDTNPLKDLFGSGDLSEVVSQLGLIVEKLEEISNTASSFNVFDNGFNVTASVGEIDKLTNRIKELEDELSKIKLNPVNVDKSNISSENITPIIEGQNRIQEELKETQEQADKSLLSIKELYNVLKQDIGSTDDREKFAIGNSSTGLFSMPNLGTDYDFISEELIYSAIEKSKEQIDSLIHTHSEKIAAFSPDDIYAAIEEMEKGIIHQYVKGMDEVTHIDFSQLSKKQWTLIAQKFEDRFEQLVDTDGWYEDEDVSQEIQDNFQKKMKQILESLIAFYLPNNKSLTDVVDTQQIENITSPIKDVFQGGTSSAEKLGEEIKNIDSATEKASESAKEYGKILSQVGLVGKQFDEDGNQIPSKYSYTRQTGENQVQTITVKYEQDKESGEIVEKEIIGDYITGFQALEKEIDKADKKVFDLKKTLESNKVKLGNNYDSSALETLISNAENEANMLYDTLLKVYDAESEYEYSIAQYADERAKKQSEYNTQLQNAKNIDDARAKNASDKKNESDEKKRLANIEQVNRALNKQQITIDAIEKTYNKTTNPDLDREVSNQQDLAELAQKKLAIQTKINSLQGQERNSANEKEFLELEKFIAEYKELAKYKLKANNPSKQELGGQNLQTLIQVQISNYDKLITKAEKYGDTTSDTVEKLKEQRDILSNMGSDGKYSATADQYYASRDTYKVESAALSAFEAETRAIEQKTQAVKKLSDELEVYNKQVPKKPADGQRSDKFKGLVQNYKNAISEAQKYLDNLGDTPVTEEIKKEWENLIGVIKKAKKEMDSIPTAERGSDALSRGKEIDTITKYLNKFTGISKQAKRELNGLLDQLQSGDPSVNVKKIHERFLELTVAERNAGREARNLFDIFKDKKIYSFLGQAASMFSFYDLIRYGRECINVIKDLDSAYTEMRKVSDETAQSLKNFQSASFDVAKQVGVTALEIQNSAADFMRLGYILKEASKLSEDANIYANVGDMDISEATEHMISSIQAWQSEFSSATEASTNIIDRYNEIGNRFAITSADIGSAMERSAAALKAGGNDLNEAIGIITAGNLIQQDADTTANAIKVLSLRLRGAKADLESMNEETDGLVESTSKMREQIQALTGVDIMIDDSTFKSTAKIIQEIGAEWSNLSDVSQAATLELLAGKTRASTVAGLIENYQTIGEVIEAAEESENSARIENEKYLDSMEGRLNLMTSQLQELASVSLNDNLLKEGISSLTKILELITDIVDTFGLLPTAAGMAGIYAGYKNVG